MSLNHVTLLGRLGKAPEVRQTQSGIPVANFDLAVNVPSKDKNTPPDWIPVVCWNETAKFVQMYLTQGRQIVVEGRISTRKWCDSDGKNHKVVEVTANRIYFADSNRDAGNGGYQTQAPAADQSGFTTVDDDDLPF